MNLSRRNAFAAALALAGVIGPLAAFPAHAQPSRGQLIAESRSALDELYATQPRARFLARHARGVLVFPSILKGAFVVGAQSGDGVLFTGGKPSGFYNISAASFGLQAGGQKFSTVLFFMNDRAMNYLNDSAGFSIGSEPNVVIIKTGAALEANSTNLTQDVYIVPFGQKGLMAGIDIQASKITHVHPD
ncbi:MAG TPA: lipid-binding SYLF domain-containing protein [Caulobacteraceae bacterium]